MGFIDKLFNRKQKDFGSTSVTGGLELLSKLIAPELSKKGMLETYKKSLYVFACVSKIATKVASVEWKLFKIVNSRGNKKEMMVHPLLDLIYKPNKFQTKTEFLEMTMINWECTGEAFWYKVRNDSGDVVELWNLRPDYVSIVSDPAKFIAGYKFERGDGTTITFMPEEIIYFKSPDPTSAYRGMGALHPGAKRVQTEEFAIDFQRNFFLNSARPDAVIKNKESTLTKEQKDDIREGWGRKYQGVKNSSKVAILEGGLEYQLISLSQKEMDYIESLKFTRDDILVAFQVPKPLLSIVEDVNRANSETAMAIFLGETIAPKIKRIVEKVNEEMTYEDFGDEFMLEVVDPTPANREMQLKEYSDGIINNYLLINEVRQREGLPPIKGGWSFYMSIANVAVGGLTGAEQKALAKRVMENNDENEKIISESKKSEEKLYDFKGRSVLKRKLKLFEETKEELEKRMSKMVKGSKRKKKEARAMLGTVESKGAYAMLINKSIDSKVGKLKDETTGFFNAQKDRVMKDLENKKSKDIKEKIKVTVTEIFDKGSENKLAVNFIIPFLTEFLKDSANEALDLVAPQEDFEETARIQKIIKKRAEDFAESVNTTTSEKLSATLSEGITAGEGIADLSKRVADVYDEFASFRSERIARTEATVANNEGLLEGFRQSNVATGKEWINSGDSRVREEHQDGIGVGGEIVALDASFSNGLKYPQEPNCRCVIGPAFLE